MKRFEYKVVPAPKKGEKARGVKRTEDRFAHALTLIMNELGAKGWEYVRSDTLPCEERSGLTSKVTTFQNMLVFRRELAARTDAQAETVAPRAVAAPAVTTPLNPSAPVLGPAFVHTRRARAENGPENDSVAAQ